MCVCLAGIFASERYYTQYYLHHHYWFYLYDCCALCPVLCAKDSFNKCTLWIAYQFRFTSWSINVYGWFWWWWWCAFCHCQVEKTIHEWIYVHVVCFHETKYTHFALLQSVPYLHLIIYERNVAIASITWNLLIVRDHQLLLLGIFESNKERHKENEENINIEMKMKITKCAIEIVNFRKFNANTHTNTPRMHINASLNK